MRYAKVYVAALSLLEVSFTFHRHFSCTLGLRSFLTSASDRVYALVCLSLEMITGFMDHQV